MPLELKQKRAGVRLKLGFVIGGQHVLLEQSRVEEPWIRLSGIRSVARMLRIDRNREFLPYREAHLKVLWYQSEVVSEVGDGGRSVKAGVIAHSPKELFSL